jgi:prepilin-type N-terminal cleavage/methylation domain-containing protein
MSRQLNQQGFTILELMIATTIFTVILLLCTIGLIRIGNIYYKGVTQSRTQAVARTISDDVTQAIQYGGQIVQNTSPTLSLMGGSETVNVGSRSYHYILGTPLADSPGSYGLRATTIDANGNPVLGKTPQELLNTGMWLSRFDVVQASGVYQIKIQVVSGDKDLIEDKNGKAYGASGFDRDSLRCKSQTGSQFCAVAGLYTEAVRRL